MGQDRCDEQCQDHHLCSGGQCVNFGVNGPGERTCPGTTCPLPPPGPNCTAFSEKGCAGCLSQAGRCGWCPYSKTCFDIALHSAYFMCPPGFTTDNNNCQKSELDLLEG